MCQNFSVARPTAIQRRHIAFGVIFMFFSIALVIAEAKRPSFTVVGYWVGAIGILPSIFAIACCIKSNKGVLIASCVSDIIASGACIAGAILSLVFFSVNVYAVGWLSVILATFQIYHAFAVFGELNICCKIVLFEISDAESEESDRVHRNRDLPAPPIGFIMPDEVPKPPNYDQLSIRGDPPIYSEVCSQRSPATPPPSSAPPRSVNPKYRIRRRSPSASRTATNVEANNRTFSLEALERT